MFSRTGAESALTPSSTRRRHRLAGRPLAAVTICAAAALAAAGCTSGGAGGAGGTASPAGVGQSAAGGTGGSAASALAIAASQASKVTSYASTLSITSTGSNASSLNGTVEMQTKPTLVAHETFSGSSAQMPIPGGMEMILTRNTIYMKLSALSKMVGKPWVKLDLSSLKNTSGLNLASMFQQFQTNNPLADTQMFAASTDVHEVGHQVINGVATTEYTGTYHISEGLTHLSPSLRKMMQPALAEMGMTTSQFTIWVDGQHQVRKLVQTESGKGTTITTTMLVTSVNQPLHIQLPPANQVAAMPGL
jgi:hypothetical protein